MPFVTQARRKQLDAKEIPSHNFEPGDRCYVYYKKMVDQWRESPRWTTAHTIYKSNFMPVAKEDSFIDNYVARSLAWQVFFQLHVIPYEEQKRKENGDV